LRSRAAVPVPGIASYRRTDAPLALYEILLTVPVQSPSARLALFGALLDAAPLLGVLRESAEDCTVDDESSISPPGKYLL
jgi:hypothetical protein